MPATSMFPPGGPIDVVFSFDTTGSMYSWLEEIRGRIQDMIQCLQADIPGIRIAVMAHGDYCDTNTYVTKWIDFTNDIVKLCDFIQNVERTGGGDAPECYELVLRQVRTELSWSTGSRRVLVLIGDDNPHQPHEACNKDKINWQDETKELALMGVTIYGVQCGRNNADLFYKTISVATGGKHLRLEDFGSLFHTLMAVCYRESHDTAMLNNYEKEVRATCGSKGLALDINAIFTSLRDEVKDTCGTTTLPVGLGTTTVSVKKKAIGSISKPKSKKSVTKLLPKVSPLTNIKTKTLKKKSASSKSFLAKDTLNKYKIKNLPLLKRENVPEVNFQFRTLHWSPWIMSLVASQDVLKGQKSRWTTRGDKPGLRLKQSPLTQFKSRPRSFVEVSVQINGVRSKKHVLFCQRVNKCLSQIDWEEDLFHRVSEQVDLVLQAGCNIYIRYCTLGHRDKVNVDKGIKRYDYAWTCPWMKRNGARRVSKCGVIISK